MSLRRAVTVVQAILVVNALPAFVNLMSIPDRTERWCWSRR